MTLAELELNRVRTKVVFCTLGFTPLSTVADWAALKELAELGLSLSQGQAAADGAVARQAETLSLDSDKPLVGGVCDMSAGCEACQ